MRNIICGALCGAFVFAALSWATAKRTVHAEILTTPPAGRFQLVQLHPSADNEWSGVLDTETGCTWVFTTGNPSDPSITNQDERSYLQILGQNAFELVNYDTSGYTRTLKLKPDKSGVVADYGPAIEELLRVDRACSQARLLALKAASAR